MSLENEIRTDRIAGFVHVGRCTFLLFSMLLPGGVVGCFHFLSKGNDRTLIVDSERVAGLPLRYKKGGELKFKKEKIVFGFVEFYILILSGYLTVFLLEFSYLTLSIHPISTEKGLNFNYLVNDRCQRLHSPHQ